MLGTIIYIPPASILRIRGHFLVKWFAFITTVCNKRIGYSEPFPINLNCEGFTVITFVPMWQINAGDFHYLLRGDGEKLHRRVTSLGEYAEKPLLESFFHLQKLLSFGYVKGAAPHGRPGWLLLTASDFQKDKPADDEYHEPDGNDRF